ncbi:MAG: tRNA (adenosine(37)-N6)-dimethylallyltransferase MiaA [Beijerinckiaceae bacterium]|nr:tRNA (adenosine(37)-N6)-dimethylallyltransferase MiaA [Beijerinckiaceae bacterium]
MPCKTLTAGAGGRADAREDGSPEAILISGPTASGKSALAAALAQQFDGVIINADSMQIYRDLRILSARPSAAEEAALPHRLYGYVEAGVEYTVGHYVKDAAEVLAAVRAEGRLPIFVGGTGLYFKALTQGLVETPVIPPAIRAELERAAEMGENLHERLQALDPESAARLSPADRPRIIRALEVVLATGRPMAHWRAHANGQALLSPGRWHGVFLTVERETLKARIHHRFEEMIEAGALDEVRKLMARGLPANRGIMKAHGVPHLVAYLQGRIPFSEAVSLGQMDTRRYAKRQMTFARGQLPGFSFVEAVRALEGIADNIRSPQKRARWRADIDALEFFTGSWRCVIHRLAFRKALGPAPTGDICLAYFEEHRARFEAAAQLKAETRALAADASLHLTSRDFRQTSA